MGASVCGGAEFFGYVKGRTVGIMYHMSRLKVNVYLAREG